MAGRNQGGPSAGQADDHAGEHHVKKNDTGKLAGEGGLARCSLHNDGDDGGDEEVMDKEQVARWRFGLPSASRRLTLRLARPKPSPTTFIIS